MQKPHQPSAQEDRRDILDRGRDERAEQKTEPEYVVTLVHGTFAPDARWMTEDSPLCREVNTLSEGKFLFHPFRWEGKWLRRYNNSHVDRQSASLKLRSELRAVLRLYPNARHFVIAHSHGGNVALQALQDPELNTRVQGIACLATPFLTGVRSKPEIYIASLAEGVRKIGWLTYLLFFPTIATALGKMFAFLPAFLALFLPSAVIDLVGKALFYAALFGGPFALWKWLPRWLNEVVAPKLAHRQNQIAERHELSDLGDLPIFTAKAKGDEVWAILRTECPGEKVLTKCCHWFMYLILFGLFLTSCVLAAMQTGEMSGSVAALSLSNVILLILLGEILFLVAFVSMFALLLPAVFLWPFAVRIAVSVPRFFSFGWEGVVDSWLFRSDVAASPHYPGSRITEREYRFRRQYRDPNRWLRHSDIYNRPEVLADLVTWMRRTG